MNFGDLRAILQYVPQFRGATFVVSLDGAVVNSPDFSNLLLDLAVLRSLNVKIVLVHGAAAQIEELGEKRGVPLSNSRGCGETDLATLEISIDAISRLTNSIMQSLTSVKIRAANANAIQAHRGGIIGGKDTGYTGRIDEVDTAVLQSFLDQDIMPVIPPLAFDGAGETLRINSDVLAREVAITLGAEKVIFLSIDNPLKTASLDSRQWSSDLAEEFLQSKKGQQLPEGFHSKLKEAIRATREKVPRVHLINAEENDALLSELFSNEGVGLMIYADAYHNIRQAEKTDTDEIYALIRRAVEDEQLIDRSRSSILEQLDDYLVLSIDGNIVGCVAVHAYPSEQLAELACLFVKNGHTGMGYGRILIEAAIRRAKELNAGALFALSTQAAEYLGNEGFKVREDLTWLPPKRHEEWASNGRNAILLTFDLGLDC